jgi:hypothetical protein
MVLEGWGSTGPKAFPWTLAYEGAAFLADRQVLTLAVPAWAGAGCGGESGGFRGVS